LSNIHQTESNKIHKFSFLYINCSKDFWIFVIIALSLLLRLICINSTSLLVEEAYYWNYAQHLDFGYLDHPPMVALLIKLSTLVFGTNEFGVRCCSLICWSIACVFSFKLTNLILEGAGRYAVMLLSILPFFFLHSLIITPDLPLIACWSLALYALFKALILHKSSSWYLAGLAIGLGLLSKYTIVLLGAATIAYMCITPNARFWFKRREAYVCALIAMLCFTPVIYWNANHHWASFAFQSTRRFDSPHVFSLPELIGLLLLFLTPIGVMGLYTLCFKKMTISSLHSPSKKFLCTFTLIPLLFFGVFSCSHAIKFNWIGPSLLATIPWLAILIQQSLKTTHPRWAEGWKMTALLLLIGYFGVIFNLITGTPNIVYQALFTKYIAWDDLTHQINLLASEASQHLSLPTMIVPLDTYGVSSELAFYQAKLIAQGKITQSYPVIGQHIFGKESLMYRYWSTQEPLIGRVVLVISNNIDQFKEPGIINRTQAISPIQNIMSHSPWLGSSVLPYYYQVVKMKK
jgi:hypothetical protein